MQIDCEVINTKLLHIREDAIPVHLSGSVRPTGSNASLQKNESHDGFHRFDSSYGRNNLSMEAKNESFHSGQEPRDFDRRGSNDYIDPVYIPYHGDANNELGYVGRHRRMKGNPRKNYRKIGRTTEAP